MKPNQKKLIIATMCEIIKEIALAEIEDGTELNPIDLLKYATEILERIGPKEIKRK